MNSNDFFKKVYEVVRLVPPGRVTTYGLIAKYLGSTKSSRTVGYAMNASHTNPDIPAHRVVNREGLLTGKHHFTNEGMEELLVKEGIVIENNQIINFNKVFWNPINELEL